MLCSTISRFIDYLSDIKNYSNHTLIGYESDLKQYLLFIGESYNLDIKVISHIHIRSWIVSLMSSDVSAKSINRKISALRAFYKYLERNGQIKKNPMLKVVTPKIPKRLPSYVDEDKIDEVLDDKYVDDNYNSLREHIIISLLYHTGIRRSELLGLTICDIDLEEHQIKVLGKGGKERLIPLNNQIEKELSKYISVRNLLFGKEELILILTDKGKPAYPKLIYNIVNRVLKKYNAAEKASPHILRHTFATHLTANGAELNAVKELLGHASLAATQVYTHNSIERLKEVYDKSHPKSKNL